jgi:DNA-binding MarR family transcriptional regulator
VWHLALRWRADVDRAVARLELSHAGYAVLASLRALTRAGETPSQQRLAVYAGSGPADVSRTVRELERDGLVMRILDPSDHRTRRLALTERGAAVADEANRIVQRLERQLMAPLGDPRGAQATAFATTLGTLLDGATEASKSPATVTHAPAPVGARSG